MFKPSNYLINSVKEVNLERIYSCLLRAAHKDPAFQTEDFMDILEYVIARKVPGFLKPYDGVPFERIDKWNEEYWMAIVDSLTQNFSIDRIEHLRDVGRYVYNQRKKSTVGVSKLGGDDLFIKAVPAVVTCVLAIHAITAIMIGKTNQAGVAGAMAIVIGVVTIVLGRRS